MAWSNPRTWAGGEKPTAALYNQEIRDNLNAIVPNGPGAWTAYTPTLTQSGSVSKTVTYARYMKIGRAVFVQVFLTLTGSGTAANGVTISLPFTAVNGGANPQECGTGFIFDTSAGAGYPGQAIIHPTTSTVAFRAASNPVQILGVAGFTAALASGDTVSMSVFYEATS